MHYKSNKSIKNTIFYPPTIFYGIINIEVINNMIILIHLFFFFIWAIKCEMIATPITLFTPFSLKIHELVKNKKYFLSTFISLIPVSIYYFSNASSYNTYTIILILLIALIPLFIITTIFIYLISFIDYYLRTKNIDDIMVNSSFYLFYLSYMTLIYFSSDRIVPLIYNLLSKVF